MRSLPGLSAKTLTERLRKLQKLGLVTRETFREVPPRVEYTLTTEGEEVVTLLGKIKEVCPKWADLG
jgi:DNA-binding HxlR family transcriptional regulator